MTLRTSTAALAMLGLLAFSGCKDFYNVNVDPLRPSSATPEQLLPGVQVALGTYLGFSLSGLGQATSTLVGQLNSSRGVGSFQQSGSSFSNQWTGLYQDMLLNNELIIKQATTPDRAGYLGVAQLQKAYAFSVMVDMWGDIPYSQALNGTSPEGRNPRFDKDQDIYLGNQAQGIESLFKLINNGIINVSKGGSGVNGDVIYKGDLSKWKAFGYTLKLKLYNQIRKVNPAALGFVLRDSVALALTKPRLMSGDDFELPYGSSFQPENRNINFLSNYVNLNREDLINQDFFKAMIDNRDPRVPFYFFSQSSTAVTATDFNQPYTLTNSPVPLPTIPTTFRPLTFNFVTVKLGTTGQLAGSADNSKLITLPGLYPSGGRFDFGGGTKASDGADFSYARGVVAQRMLTVASRYFTEAELQLFVLNQPAAARAAYLQGIQEAFTKLDVIGKADGTTTSVTTGTGNGGQVPAIGPATPSARSYIDGTPPVATTPATPTDPINALRRYDGATNNTTNEQKLAAIIYEKYVAGFGTGPDLFTDYRRTNYPVSFRPPGEVPGTVATGGVPRRLFWDVQELTTNSNAPRVQRDAESRLFWDN